jgi:protein tyrosine phosphatase
MKLGPFDASKYPHLSKCKASIDTLPQGVGSMNRYVDILPNPSTRVMLAETPSDPASGYINANWIKGFTGDAHEYIASQGPMPNTVNAFWRMVWESKTKAVVMVTGLTERGVQKCARYGPPRASLPNVLPYPLARALFLSSGHLGVFAHSSISIRETGTGQCGSTTRRKGQT